MEFYAIIRPATPGQFILDCVVADFGDDICDRQDEWSDFWAEFPTGIVPPSSPQEFVILDGSPQALAKFLGPLPAEDVSYTTDHQFSSDIPHVSLEPGAFNRVSAALSEEFDPVCKWPVVTVADGICDDILHIRFPASHRTHLSWFTRKGFHVTDETCQICVSHPSPKMMLALVDRIEFFQAQNFETGSRD